MTSAPTPGGPSWQQDPATPAPAEPPASSSFFRWIRGLDITRAPDRWVGGVSGGVARRTGLDLALVRGLIVILAVFGGIGVLLYGLAWALLPEPDGRIHVEQAGRGSWTSGLTGAAALVAIGLWRPNLPFLGEGGAGGLLWTLFWIGAVVLFVYWIINRSGGGRIVHGAPGGPQDVGGGPAGTPHSHGGPAAFPPAPFGPASRPVPPTPGERMAFTPSAGAPTSGTGPALPRTAPDGDDGDPDVGRARDETLEQRTIPLPQHPGALTQPLPASAPLPHNPAGTGWTGSSTWAGSGSQYPAPGFYGAGSPPSGSSPGTARPRPARPSGSATALLVGGTVILAATLLTLDYLDVLDLVNPAVVALAAAAIVLALGVVVLGARGRTSGLVGLTAALATIGALVSSFTIVGGAWIVAQENRTTPTSLRAAEGGYSIMAAHTTIDLTELPRPASDITVPVNSLASGVTVIVPEDVFVQIRTRMALGNAEAISDAPPLGESRSEFSDREGLLQLSNGELNPDAAGAALILEVRGALSDVSITTAPGTDTLAGDTP
ncbi:PspC domain-containing protein [Arthrobacter sp. NamB2]|uniref:PspC domain-containing protein n=1 Tax=Arthrobacter sp. NamB2 TaxID=2576035 RepID=UPI0010C99C1C|nr:PspC domain-containing protein [Arthrobacter sp. NamB2]TKV29454.1 PspC domain-containing protein [Arthrobacter sp. NamB2]